MLAMLNAYQINVPPAEVSAVWAAQCALRAAKIAIEELQPRNMRGFGELSDSAKRDLNDLVSQLLDLLAEMESRLTPGTGACNQRANSHFADRDRAQHPDNRATLTGRRTR